MNQLTLTPEALAELTAMALAGDGSAEAALAKEILERQGIQLAESNNDPTILKALYYAPSDDQSMSPVQVVTSASPVLPQSLYDFPFFTLNQREALNRPNRDESPEPLSGSRFQPEQDAPPFGPTPNKALITPSPSLLNELTDWVRAPTVGQAPDITALVDGLARLQLPDPIPWQPLRRAASWCYIYLDTSEGDDCYRRDFFHLIALLQQQLPDTRFRLILFPNGPQAGWLQPGLTAQFSGQLSEQPVPVPDDSSTPCLLLINHHPNTRLRWRHLLDRLQQRHITPHWLTLAPASNVPGIIRCWGRQVPPEQAADQLTLMTGLLLSVRIINGGLLRQLIHAANAPDWLEAAFWHQPFVRYSPGADRGEIHLSADEKSRYRTRLNQLDNTALQRWSGIIEAWVGTLSASMLHEHRLHFALLTSGTTSGTTSGISSERASTTAAEQRWQHPELAQSQAFMQTLGQNLLQRGEGSHYNARFLQATIEQFDGYLADTKPGLQRTLVLASAWCVEHGITHTIPKSLADAVQQQLAQNASQSGQTVAQTVTLYQQQGRLIADWSSEKQTNTRPQPPVASLPLADNTSPLLIKTGQSTNLVKSGQPLPALNLSNNHPLVIQSPTEALTLSLRNSHDFYWANLTINAEGVIAETDSIVVYWPTNDPATIKHRMQLSKLRQDEKYGCYIGLKPQAPAWLSQFPPQLDDYGVFSDITLTPGQPETRFRLRYIPPGEFLMGSPKDEPQRLDRELQHPVILTQGYWLGETPVTQALWQAVMGNNPSHFTPEGDEQLPVEQVSWDDCQQFFNRVSELLPGLSMSLPTEAQWEYACRAGSQTPFNTGEQLTTDQANYRGSEPYKGRVALTEQQQQAQLYRRRTVDVHRFSPNDWGLKQMHGNVLEWCQDGRREYHAEVALDPVGPGKQSDRALRGGSWLHYGRYCRSAHRSRNDRDERSRDIGFRAQVILASGIFEGLTDLKRR